MSVATSTIWEFNTAATASMVNGGGFNYQATGPLNDGSWGAANTASPTLSSATYTFVAGDVGNWIYSTNTTIPGFYKIDSVSTGIATLDAGAGAGVIFDTTTQVWKPNTTDGVDASATVSSKSFLVDYSQATAAVVNGLTDFGAVGASSTLTSASAPFTPAMVGNIYHQTTTGTGGFGTVGWYEITGYTNATTVSLDRSPNGGTASVACTGYIGGALSLNSSLEDSYFEQIQGGNRVYFKSGTYTAGGAVAVASTASTGTNPSNIIGYVSIRGDTCAGSNRPTIALAANTYTFGQFQNVQNMSFTGTAASVYNGGTGSRAQNVKALNSSTTATRAAFSGGTDSFNFDIECVCQLGRGLYHINNNAKYQGVYAHHSHTGVYVGSSRATFSDILIYGCSVVGVAAATATTYYTGLTIRGYATPVSATSGVLISNAIDDQFITNSIISGWATGIAQTTAQRYSNRGAYNCFYNNTTNATLYNLDPTDITTDPAFTDVTELTGSTATTSGSVLTQSGGDFSTVTDNVDYVHIVSGTGITAGQYLITSHTSTTITLNNAPGTSATADKVWKITIGKDLSVGANMKAQGFPGAYPGSSTTSYLDIGAAQRQEPAGGGSGGSYTFAG